MEVEISYKDGLYFETSGGKQAVGMDASPQHGGQGRGMLPKELLLASLAGCTGMDVVSILNKMKAPFAGFNVKVQAEKSKGEPIVFTSIHIQYIFSGQNIDRNKVEKAVSLSQEKYCGISAMLRKAAKITWKIVYI